MTVAVVIPCRNEQRTVPRLLDAVAAQTRPPSQIVIVNDGSTDDTVDAVAAWSRAHPHLPLTVIDSGGRGAGAAMNAGIGAATADVIVRLDGHCGPRPDYIERSLRTLETPRAGVAGGVWQIEPGASTLQARGIAAVLSHPLGSGGAEYRSPSRVGAGAPIEVDTVPFGAFPRALWQRVGGFDERLIRNQDYDFNHRVRLTGHSVLLDPAIVSTYSARPTLGALARQYFGYGFWKVAMLRKFPRSIRLRQLLPILLMPALLGALIAGAAGIGAAWWGVLAYLAANGAGAVQASVRAGDPAVAPAAFAALLVLQFSWSVGAWSSLLRGARAAGR